MPAPWHHQGETALIRKITVGAYENNVYVVACATTSKAVIVDAAFEPDRIAAAVTDVEPVAILTTHGHFDHVGAAADTAQRLGIPFRLHPADAGIAGMTPDEPLHPGPVMVGDLAIEARHTPGHTPGSLCFVVPGVVLSGDTLFPGGPGATSSADSSFPTIIDSIATGLFTLDEATLVMPGHGLDTTIGTERSALDEWRERGW